MIKRNLFLTVVLTLSILKQVSAQHELGLTRDEILNLPWVKEYHKTNPIIPGFERDFMHVKTNEYHYTIGFSTAGICVSETLESRRYMSDIKLRDYLSLYGVPLSTSTYIVTPQKGNKFFACIVATHNDLPHQVSFSYEQIFKTNSTPRKDTYPYEFNNK
jgi:hypothetical protein